MLLYVTADEDFGPTGYKVRATMTSIEDFAAQQTCDLGPPRHLLETGLPIRVALPEHRQRTAGMPIPPTDMCDDLLHHFANTVTEGWLTADAMNRAPTAR